MAPGYFFDLISLTLIGLLPLVNPFSVMPLFLALTAEMDDRSRRRQALKGSVYGFLILVVFLLLGSFIIEFFGISVSGIRAAGGMIITVIGFRMLYPDPEPTAGAHTAGRDLDISFTPLAMPSLAGPGSISLVLSAPGHIDAANGGSRPLAYLAVIVGIAFTFLIAYITLLGAGYLVRLLGKSGTVAMTRIFGFLLICIGIQFVLSGIASFFHLAAG